MTYGASQKQRATGALAEGPSLAVFGEPRNFYPYGASLKQRATGALVEGPSLAVFGEPRKLCLTGRAKKKGRRLAPVTGDPIVTPATGSHPMSGYPATAPARRQRPIAGGFYIRAVPPSPFGLDPHVAGRR